MSRTLICERSYSCWQSPLCRRMTRYHDTRNKWRNWSKNYSSSHNSRTPASSRPL